MTVRAGASLLMLMAAWVAPCAAVADDDFAYGRRLFLDKAECSFCHGWPGDGSGQPQSPGRAANLRKSQSGREALITTILCGIPDTAMPHFDELAYTDRRCYGMTEAELGSRTPTFPPSTTLQRREVEVIADYLLARVIGRGEVTREECLETFGAARRSAATIAPSREAVASRQAQRPSLLQAPGPAPARFGCGRRLGFARAVYCMIPELLPRRRPELGMANSPTVSDDFARKFATERETPYVRWVRGEGLDIISAQYVANLRTVDLRPWPRRGGKGVYINHDASRFSNDCYVCEIPAGGKLAPQRQLYEEMILILDGRGSTSVWNDAGKRITFEWKAGAIFAIPLNAWHQHFNGSGQESVRYVAVTNSPAVINMYDDINFVFNMPAEFPDRFAGEADYFTAKAEQKGFLLVTNFVADAVNLPLISAKERGAGGGHIRFNMAKGSMSSHISQFPVGTYKKAHAHGPSAHVIILSGEGYSLMWREGEEPTRFDWQVGSLIVPPNRWFHQHFNTGPTPARYLAFKHEIALIRNLQGVPTAWISQRVGGDQIDYADEGPQIRDMFAQALARHGMTARMEEVYRAEVADLPPKAAPATSLSSEAAE